MSVDIPGDMGSLPREVAFELAKKWWVLLLRGIILILLGILAFVSPTTWVIFVGAYALVEGVAMLIAGISNQPGTQHRWLLIIIGVLSIIAGIYIFANPGVAGLTLTFVIAVWAIVTGVLEIIQAIRLREEIDNEWWLILGGALAVIFGLLVLFGGSGQVNDDAAGFTNVGLVAGFLAISYVFGIFAIVAGIFSIMLSLKVRDFGTKIGAVT